MTDLSYRKRIVFRTGLTLFAVLIFSISFLIAEVVFRLYLSFTGAYQPVIQNLQTVLERTWFQPHPQLIYTFKPNHIIQTHVFDGYTLSTNRYGFRHGLEFDIQTKEKKPGEFRIATLGGSTTMGVNQDDEI